jgi:hypothetical protein
VKSDVVLIKSKEKREMLAGLDQRVSFELSKLLKAAPPDRNRVHQLAKLLKDETGHMDLEYIKRKIFEYYVIPFERRTLGQFKATFGIHPSHWLYNQFILNFSTASITDTQLALLASKLRYFIAAALNPPKALIETDFLHLALFKLLQCRSDEKNAGLGLLDLLESWKQTSIRKWGEKYSEFFEEIDKYSDFNARTPLTKPPITRGTIDTGPGTELNLTQSELDWMRNIVAAIEQNLLPPIYPNSKGPQKPATRQIDKLIRILRASKNSTVMIVLQAAAKDLCSSYLKIYKQVA